MYTKIDEIKNMALTTYIYDLFGYVKENLSRKDLDWDFELDMGGSWALILDSEHQLFCSPYWEGSEGISISLMDIEGEELLSTHLDFPLGFDKEKDAKRYVEILETYLSKLKKKWQCLERI